MGGEGSHHNAQHVVVLSLHLQVLGLVLYRKLTP